MTKKFQLLLLFVFVLVYSSTVLAQNNKFEGYNIILSVPETHKSATCSLRYAPPTNSITISDLDTATPMNIKPCDGSGTNLTQNGSTASMNASSTNYKWCFRGEDKRYRISFKGDQYNNQIVYDWIPTPEKPGIYNIKDFGAIGDGRADDTIAIQSALAFMATRNGGILQFSEGDYVVGNSPNFNGITIPSGVTIQGVSGVHTGAASNNVVKKNPTRITLSGRNRAMFRIGECTEKVNIKDIELFAESNENTFGIEAVGAFGSSQDFYFENVVFNSFYRGIYVHGLPATDLVWQFDYVKVARCRFVFNRDAGVYTNARNTGWKIVESLFINPKKQPGQNANSMHFERAAGIFLQDTMGGGFPNALGGTFLNILDSASVMIIASQTEAMTNSIVYNEVENPGAGDYSYPFTVINSTFGNPIIFKARRTFVSTGNFVRTKYI